MVFYNNFIALCAEKAVTPSAVMRAIGLNKSSASYWKKGSIPSTETLQKLADYFDVSIDYLLGKEDLHEDTASILDRIADEHKLSKVEQRILAMFLEMDDPARSALLGYASRLVEESRNKPSEQNIPMDIDSRIERYRYEMLKGIATAQAGYTIRPEDIDIDSITLTPELNAMIDDALEKYRHTLEAEMQDSK